MRCRRQRGFTLVELVTVMAILSILSIGTVFYLRDASSGFASTVARDELVGTGRFALQRIAAEIRDALPTSVRSNGPCLEYLPVVAATHYLNLPTAKPRIVLKAVPVDPPQFLDGLRAAVPVGGNPYVLGPVAAVSPPVRIIGPDAGNEILVQLDAPHRFVAESETDRFYFVGDPTSICADGTRLFSYTGYGWNAVQPGVAGLPAGLPDRAMLAENLLAGAASFNVLPPTLQRNAVVEVTLPLNRDGTDLELASRIQVRNVP